jgi:hypothetical protein
VRRERGLVIGGLLLFRLRLRRRETDEDVGLRGIDDIGLKRGGWSG